MTSKAPENQASLANRAARWRKAMQDADTGPLVIAREVVDVAETWETHKTDANGLTLNQWLQRTFGAGKTLRYWSLRDEAVEALGEASRRTFHHEVAVWVVGIVPAEKLEEVKFAVMRERKANGDTALTMAQARPVVLEIIGHICRPKKCARCGELERRVAELETMLAMR